MSIKQREQRGSALLIVLGLLGFLLISAVAFSVSMRTEKSAAAAYRSGLVARELLTSVFAEARYTVDQALDEQLGGADPFNTPAARTAENLAPFYEGNGKYARLISSSPKGQGSNDDIAYLLDDAALRHVPPAIAATVYNILENDDDLNGTADTSKSGSGYYFDKSARWQTVSVARPERKVDVGHQTQRISNEVIGRMAWAAINVSDMLDVNAIGSISQRRGIGFTGSEFAFGTLGTQPSNAQLYDLFPNTSPDATPSDLPIFASGADLTLYAARSDGSVLTQDDGSVYPFSWEDAVATDGNGAYAPFTVYSFWPDETRRKEDGTNPKSADTIACSEVDEQYLASGAPSELSDLVNNRLGSSGSTLANNFYNLLRDYVDTDSIPGEAATPNNVIPTVEPVPMVSEVGYLTSSSQASTFNSGMQDALKKGFKDGESLESSVTEAELAQLTDLSKMQDLKFAFPKLALETAVRTYFPGSMSSPNTTFTISPEGFAAVYVTGYSNKDTTKQIVTKDEPQTVKFPTSSGAGTVTGGQDVLFETYTGIKLEPSSDFSEVEIDGSKIVMEAPTIDPATKEPIDTKGKEIVLNCLVDFIFRIAVLDDAGNKVDVVPCFSTNNPPSESSYPAESSKNRSIATRLSSDLRAFDRHYFRVTRPVSVKFYARWKVDKDGTPSQGQPQKYKVSLKLSSSESGDDLTLSNCLSIPNSALALRDASLQLPANGTASCESFSPDYGAWFAIDPRYNWISPMMGVADQPTTANYGNKVGSIFAPTSSPHWFFVDQAQVGSSADTPSDVQSGYAEAAQSNGYVPFVWELGVENIRYGYGNSGQLLLPQEVGFLPIPLENTAWSPSSNTYNTFSLENYYNTVAKASFFRTIPVTDFEDSALSQDMYDRYGNLCTMFGRFGGENMPEEHRGIMSAFAGMDDYYLSQRLKRMAMMGIPSSIQEAAKVSVDRLQEASDSKRVPSELMTDLQTLKTATTNVTLSQEAKYDEFVRDYLFYVPSNSSAGSGTYSWDEDQETYKGGGSALPEHPQTVSDVILQQGSASSSSSGSGSGSTNLFTEKLKAYNGTKGATEKLGQNDLTTLVAIGNSSFGDRQQLFLYIMRADTIKTSSSSTSRNLSEYRPQSTARAVALVWRDAYGQLPERVIYFQYLP